MKKRYLIFCSILIVILFILNQYCYSMGFNDEIVYETISTTIEDIAVNNTNDGLMDDYIYAEKAGILLAINDLEIKSEENIDIWEMFSNFVCKVGGVNILKSKHKDENVIKSDNYESIILLILLIYICTEVCEYLITTNTSGLDYFNTQQFKRLEKHTLYKDAIVDDKDIPPSQIENETLYYKANSCCSIIMT